MAHHHHASPYHDVRNVPMIASPLFKVPVPVSPPYDMHPLPEDLLQRRFHDFVLEHRIVQEYQRILSEEAAHASAKELQYRAYVEEREARLKQERISRARKIAPGFLDNDDRKILTPTLASTTPVSTGSPGNQSPAIKHQPAIDYSEFELQDNNAPTSVINSTKAANDTEDGTQSAEGGDTLVSASASAVTTTVMLSDPNTGDDVDETAAAVDMSDEVVKPLEVTEEQIVRAVPLSELTGLLRNSALGTSGDSGSSSRPQAWNTVPEKSTPSARVDFREFEQGLGPPDPWEAPVDDLAALKDVISQQLGQSSTSSVTGSHPAPHQQDSTATQPHRPYHTPDPYAHPGPAKQGLAHTGQAHPMPAPPPSYSMANDIRPASTAHFHSSPLPIGASAGVVKQHQQLMEYNQAYMVVQQHQQQSPPPPPLHPHRHSTTGLSANQQHARFGSVSPSPPPVPPPPRDLTSSPLSATSSGQQTRQPGTNQPPVPARPSQLQSSSGALGSSPNENVVITDRSMSSGGSGVPPPRPPPPPSSHSSSLPTVPARPSRHGEGLENSVGVADIGGMTSNMSSPEQQVPLPPNASMLIDQLVNIMGFTREQSREALEKYDYDLEKASNHLLDWG